MPFANPKRSLKPTFFYQKSLQDYKISNLKDRKFKTPKRTLHLYVTTVLHYTQAPLGKGISLTSAQKHMIVEKPEIITG